MDFRELYKYGEYTKKGIEEKLLYRIYIPENAENRNLPVMVFLHGIGERGYDNEVQLNVGFAKPYIEKEFAEEFPAIFIVPQCPGEGLWAPLHLKNAEPYPDELGETDTFKLLVSLIEETCEKYNADRSRIYITGLSMGGFGTWNMIMNHPDLFAAAVPICGGGDFEKADRIVDLPIRAYHSADDPVVPVECTRALARSLEGHNAKDFIYIEFENLGHGCWDAVYEDRTMLEWLFSKKK